MTPHRQYVRWNRRSDASFSSLALVMALLSASALWISAETPAVAAEVEIPFPTPFDEPIVLQARALRGLRAGVIGEMFTGEDGGKLTFAALTAPAPANGGSAEVPVAVEIDGARFLEFSDRDLARLEVYVYAFGPGRQIADFLAEVIVVDTGAHGERIWQSGVEYFGRLRLPPGEYTLRILVRDFHSGARGLSTHELVVPEVEKGTPLPLTPLFPEPAGRDVWIPVRSWDAREDGDGPHYPMLAVGSGVNPSSRPVLVSGRETVALLPVADAASEVTGGELRVLVAGGEAEESVASAVLERVESGESAAAGIRLLELGFVTPDLTPGTYRGRFDLTTADGGTLRSEEIDLLVADQVVREAGLLWSEMRWLLGSGTRPAEPPEVDRAKQRSGRRAEKKRRRAEAEERRKILGEMAGRYRALVEGATGSGGEQRLAALVDLEAEALRETGGVDLESLRELELSVAASFGTERPDELLPIAVMHGDMYSRYRGRRMYALMDHTRSLLEELTNLYVDRGGNRESGARILIDMAGYLQEANLAGSSRRLFGQALELDPRSDAALLGLAVSHERYGEYTQAIGYLERLTAAAPGFEEARLRLAVNLERVGLHHRTLDLHEKIMAAGGSDWVTAVAGQEIARLYMQKGDLERAAEALELTVAQMPGRGSSRILMAHVYDRLGFARQALEQLAAVVPSPGSRHSERLVYDRWPQTLLERSRAVLREEAARATRSTTLASNAEGEGEEAQ